MNRLPFQRPPRFWPPKLSPFWVRMLRGRRLRKQHREQRLLEVEVRGLEHLARALDEQHGILLTPNHPGHADSYAMYHLADSVHRPFFFMTAWQVFATSSRMVRWVLQWHGCFSVDREGQDKQAIATAVTILRESRYPLVIFPEGEVYHQNDRVTPFRDGPAAIALMAARRAQRVIDCIPCALKYFYVQDPMPELTELMNQLEARVFWRPRPALPLADRIYRFAEGTLALKELEYLGHTRSGPLPERIANLSHQILESIEQRRTAPCKDGMTIPERVKAMRRAAILGMEKALDDHQRRRLAEELDDLFLIVQLFSYPGDYVAARPTVERLAETLDKLEEDVLDRPYATIRGARRAVVALGEPISLEPRSGEKPSEKQSAPALTQLLESRVQQLLDQVNQEAQEQPEPTTE